MMSPHTEFLHEHPTFRSLGMETLTLKLEPSNDFFFFIEITKLIKIINKLIRKGG